MFGQLTAVGLSIFQGRAIELVPQAYPATVCTMGWISAGIERINTALSESRLVQLGITHRSNYVSFTAHIDGVQQKTGVEFEMKSVMHDTY